jgi:hypothetical protein
LLSDLPRRRCGSPDEVLDDLARVGIALLNGVTAPVDLLTLADSIGTVVPHRDSRPDGVTVIEDRGATGTALAGFSCRGLSPHTDRSSVERPPGLVLAVCGREPAAGGEFVLVTVRRFTTSWRLPTSRPSMRSVLLGLRSSEARTATLAVSTPATVVSLDVTRWLRQVGPESLIHRAACSICFAGKATSRAHDEVRRTDCRVAVVALPLGVETPPGMRMACPAEFGKSADVLDDPVDAAGQCADVGRLDGREHADAQLVAAQLAVRLGVHDAVRAQGLGHDGRV